MSSGLSGGCPILAAAIEFDDVPGPVHDAAARHFAELQRLIVKFAPRRKAGWGCRGAGSDNHGPGDVASGRACACSPTGRRAR